MKITKIKLKNFRNILDENIEFSDNINIFIGDNAQGKTNILESIYTLALSKSHRNNSDLNLIMDGKDFLRVDGNITYRNKKSINQVIISVDGKKLKINSNIVNKISDYVSKINVIMFTPDDLNIIKKSPQLRRNLLNTQLCQLDNKYTNLLNEYNKILKIRNECLKGDKRTDDIYLEIVTDKLIDRAIEIYKYRISYLDEINSNISNIFYKITKSSGLTVVYNRSLNSLDKNELKNFYRNNLVKEKFQKMTLYGPHRDDFSFYIGEKDIKIYGSQGQQRSAVLAYKIAEINLFKKKTSESPIVLLDDVFSELDSKKQSNFIKFIKSRVQYFITTTDLNSINRKLLEDAYVFIVKNGKIVRKEVYKNGTRQ